MDRRKKEHEKAKRRAAEAPDRPPPPPVQTLYGIHLSSDHAFLVAFKSSYLQGIFRNFQFAHGPTYWHIFSCNPSLLSASLAELMEKTNANVQALVKEKMCSPQNGYQDLLNAVAQVCTCIFIFACTISFIISCSSSPFFLTPPTDALPPPTHTPGHP